MIYETKDTKYKEKAWHDIAIWKINTRKYYLGTQQKHHNINIFFFH